nr:MAG TPA: hypothetical protein [Crassvirales sp.]
MLCYHVTSGLELIRYGITILIFVLLIMSKSKQVLLSGWNSFKCIEDKSHTITNLLWCQFVILKAFYPLVLYLLAQLV